ncbi:alpha/beta hydrolase domain-containing protein [Dehalococcoidia bacterium]|nr:alpha/beta hydrolase domain-containing protein [Dehalococcoidia bacterium]
MAVTALEIHSRMPFDNGQSFDDVGPYQFLEGKAHFSVNPLHSSNTRIVDLELAPREAGGRVRFSADFAMLQPLNPQKGNGRILFDVVNRGRKTVLAYNSVQRAMDPDAPLSAGNGFLMRHGFTVVWCGWQADVPPAPQLIGLSAPQALGSDGKPLTGRILCQFQCDTPTTLFLLADRQHLPHPPVDVNDPSALLTVRDHPNAPGQEIPSDRWSFVRVEDEQIEPKPSHVHMPSGFEPGRIYQLVYETAGGPIVGLGLAAVRDVVSYLKHAPADVGNPCANTIDYAYAQGISQSGRFLRTLIYDGLNRDEQGRTVLDGIIAHVAGGMRGEFNLRFGQPSKDVCYIIPGLFPFTDTPQSDPVTGDSGSILARLEEEDAIPKIMFINTSAEYWRGDAALIHTDLETMMDAPESENVRRYHFAGCQHSVGVFPPETIRASDGLKGQLPFNAVDYRPLLRAALINLDRWISGEEDAPASRHPSLDQGTAVESHTLRDKLAMVPGMTFGQKVTRAMRLDYGPESHLGRTVKLPAEPGEEYPALVSDLDEDGNEMAGIRLPDLSVPLATYSGWNLRHPDNGNPGLVIGITGGLAGWTVPFAGTRELRETGGDGRLSIEERYESKVDYLGKVDDAISELVDERHILEEDIQHVKAQAALRYDYWMAVREP